MRTTGCLVGCVILASVQALTELVPDALKGRGGFVRYRLEFARV
jgi:hypothetical protein